MKRVLVTGAGSYVGESVKKYISASCPEIEMDMVDTIDGHWKSADFRKYDVVFHVAGIAHVNPKPEMAPLYYKVNRDLCIEVANEAKKAGVGQFIFMSSMIVYHESCRLGTEILTNDTKPAPNDFYGDSKLQAEAGLHELECESFKVCILRPPMIYGPNSKGNFSRLRALSQKTPLFPAYHNKRSMLYIDNLAEFVKQVILRGESGTFFPQNGELSDTVEIIRFFAAASDHKLLITKILNPFVVVGSSFVRSLNKMFASYYYDPVMSRMDFDYQLVGLEESLKRICEGE